MEYIRICEGLKTKGELIPSDLDIFDYVKSSKDLYRSIYKYTETHFKHFQNVGTIAGITDVTSDRLVFDFDGADVVSTAKDDALTLCGRLIKMGVPSQSLQISYSGSKGFHVELDIDKDLNPIEYRNVVIALAGDLNTFDPVVNNASRIIRLVLTKHQNSGLYKYPLSLDDLSKMSIPQIMKWAEDISNFDKEELDALKLAWSRIKLPESIYELKDTETTLVTKDVVIRDVSDLNFSLKPNYLSNCKYALVNGFFDAGSVSNSLMVVASTFKSQGLPEPVVTDLTRSVAKLQAERVGGKELSNDEIYNKFTKQIYSATWKGGNYSCRTNPFLKSYCDGLGDHKCKHEEDDESLISTVDMFSDFNEYATEIDKNTIVTGIESLDKKVRITTSMLVGVLAAPSAGKTTIGINILNEISLSGEKCAFYSLDMGVPLVYQKLAQKFTGYNSASIFRIFKDNMVDKKTEIKKIVEDNYKNVTFNFKSGITVDDIRRDLINYEENTGEKLRLVVVDYLECLVGPYSDSNANAAIIAQKLKDLANELKICVVLLLQPQKHAGDPSEPLLSYRKIKGASVIEQACSVIISLWREGFNPEHYDDDKFISFAVLKNRMGELSKTDCSWEGLRGIVGSLSAEQEAQLRVLRTKNEERKKEKESGW